ncbi:MAG: hypothetical protein JO253_05070, partial [Alphaproteobacteria bacterium]|nr:hypothetical protein [Alphaproteobacteria bacterium]
SNNLLLGTNNTVRMTILSGGNVGIGSTAPATLLDVNGAATIRGNLTVTGTVTGGAVSVTLGTSAASPTPSRTGESNTGLFSPASGAVAVSSLSNEMMRVNATGVGIGTTTIANKLDVNGAVSIGYLNTATTSNSLIVSNAIGVGTTTPLYPLDVNGMVQSRTGGFQIVNPNNANASASLSWYNDGTNDWPRIRYGGTGSGSGTGFQIQGSGNAVKFTVLDSGNVGIGTTAPIGLLNVYGTGGSGQIYWGSTGAVGSLFAGAGNAGVGTYNNYPLIFWTNNSAAQMTLSTAGYLGIGTTAPTSLLSVYGGGLAVGTYAATANVGVGSAVFSGNVGVGQASPAYPLDVETSGGTNAIYGSSNGVANGVGVYGNATGSSGKGVYGNGAFGVYGSGTTYGVDGASTSGTGVYANTTSGYGVQGTAIGTTGTNYGVWGNSASSGGYGVYGTNTSSGIGGYFSSTSGYALVTNTGNVGIGSTTPATLLDVNGATTIRGNLTVTGTCTGCGGGGGSSTLGTAIGSSSPYRSGDTTTGLYTAGAGLVDVAASNTQAVEFSSTKVNIPLTTAASSTATGALVVAGGAGIGGSLYSGAHVVSVASGTGISGTNTGASGTTYGLKGDTSANTTTGGYAVYANGNASGYGVYSAAGLNYFNGNVGVGTASPGVPLDVAGYARVYSATQFRGFVVNNTTNNVAILQGGSATNDNGQLSLSNAGTAGIFLTASGSSYLNGGNVGIGTTAPSAALDSMSATTAAIFENPVTNTSYSGGTPVWVRNSGTATNNNYLLFTEGWNGSSGTNFGSLSFGANSSFTIANPSGNAVALQPSSGNVGIGTTSPDFNLTVQGGGSNNIHIKNANTDVGWGFSSDSTTGRLIINEPNVAERVSILTNGNVGIGTVNPQMGLHVYNTTNWGQLLLEGNNNGVALNIKNDGTGGNQWQIASTNNASTYGAGDLVFALLNSNTIVNMQTNGGMLLGTTYASGSTTAPANGLAVQGSVGIGTVGPTNVFTVDKAATTAATASTYHEAVNISGLNYLTMGANSSYALIQSWQSLPLYLNSQGNNVLIGGNVGIGTTSPTGVLNVNGGANSPIVRVEGTSNPVMTVLDDSGTNGELILGVVTSGGSYSNVASAGDAVVRTGLNAAGAGGNLILTSRTATGNIMFATQAPDTTKMIITNAGNVGIGTTSPATLLDVNGAATIRGNLTITGTCTGCGSGSLSWPLAGAADTVSAPDYAWSGHTNTGLYYNTGVGFTVGGSGVGTFTSSGLQLANVYSNGGPLYINNVTPNNTYLNGGGGYVGIGANSASYTLDVNGTIADRGSRFETGLDGTNTFWIGNVSGSEPNNLAMGYNTNGSGTVQTLQFATAGSTRMVVNSSGNVGIGSATPRYNLDVNGNIYSDGSAIGSWSNALGIAQGGNVNYMQVDASGNTYFASNHSASFEFMGGNVGIGTTSPFSVLEVHETPGQNITFIANDNGNYTGAAGIQAINDTNTAYVPMGFYASQFYLGGGNVGIGNNSPSAKLQVTGNAWVNAGSGNTGTRAAGLTVDSGVSSTYSNGTDPGDGNRTLSVITSANATAPTILTLRNISANPFWDIVMDPNDGEKLKFSEAGYQPTMTLYGSYVGIGNTTPVAQLDLGTQGAIQAGASGAYLGFNVYYNGGWKYKATDYGYYIR